MTIFIEVNNDLFFDADPDFMNPEHLPPSKRDGKVRLILNSERIITIMKTYDKTILTITYLDEKGKSQEINETFDDELSCDLRYSYLKNVMEVYEV